MINSLFDQLMQRQLASGPPSQVAQPPLPTAIPSVPTKVPQRAKRWSNANQIADAYRGGWQPNPILLRTILGNK